MSADLQPAIAWPARITPSGDGYNVPGVGQCVRVTKVLKVLGLGTEALIAWSAKEERKACIEAAKRALLEQAPGESFISLMEANLGPARSHEKLLAKASDVGSSIHRAVERYLKGEPQPELSSEATIGFLAFRRWFDAEGLKPVRTEQTVWHSDLKYAGTVDAFCLGPDGYELLDLKSGANVYAEAHLQCAAYVEASPVPLTRVRLVRVPKSLSDPLLSGAGVEVVELGQMFKRTLSQPDLFRAFQAALTAYRLLIEPQA